jgi:hypothetical protein
MVLPGGGMTCVRKHATPVEGCRSCRLLATSDSYRAAVARLRKQPPPPKVGEPPSRKHHLPKPAAVGPGTELKRMTSLMGIPACKACHAYAAEMDGWGVAGCRDRFEEIVKHLEHQAARLGWFKWVQAGAKAVVLNLPKTARGLAEEAIRRAESNNG